MPDLHSCWDWNLSCLYFNIQAFKIKKNVCMSVIKAEAMVECDPGDFTALATYQTSKSCTWITSESFQRVLTVLLFWDIVFTVDHKKAANAPHAKATRGFNGVKLEWPRAAWTQEPAGSQSSGWQFYYCTLTTASQKTAGGAQGAMERITFSLTEFTNWRKQLPLWFTKTALTVTLQHFSFVLGRKSDFWRWQPHRISYTFRFVAG